MQSLPDEINSTILEILTRWPVATSIVRMEMARSPAVAAMQDAMIDSWRESFEFAINREMFPLHYAIGIKVFEFQKGSESSVFNPDNLHAPG